MADVADKRRWAGGSMYKVGQLPGKESRRG